MVMQDYATVPPVSQPGVLYYHTLLGHRSMTRTLITLTLISGLCGCVVAPPYSYAPAPGYYYGYAPGYYAAPPVSIGIGGVFHVH